MSCLSRWTVRTVAMPRGANASGDIFGGWTLSQMDLAGHTFVAAHSDTRSRPLPGKEG